MLKKLFRKILDKSGVNLSLRKNLWYLDAFVLLKRLSQTSQPVVFDVGGCQGSTIIEFQELFPECFIYSFEPFPDSFICIESLIKTKKNVEVFPLALSDVNGKLSFYTNISAATNSLFPAVSTQSFIDNHTVSTGKIEVDSVRLSDFCNQQKIDSIDILKIDVQGGELKVLHGAEELLREKKIKLIYCEIWFLPSYEDQPLYHEIASYLQNFGYKPFGIYNMHYRKSDGHFLWGDAIFTL